MKEEKYINTCDLVTSRKLDSRDGETVDKPRLPSTSLFTHSLLNHYAGLLPVVGPPRDEVAQQPLLALFVALRADGRRFPVELVVQLPELNNIQLNTNLDDCFPYIRVQTKN